MRISDWSSDVCSSDHAGRVQSPALRMIVEREEEIEAFVAREYWSVEAECAHPVQAFTAKLTRLDGKKFEQFTVTDGDTAEQARRRIVSAANGALHVTDRKSTRLNSSH